ncbi:MAG: acyl-CoA thioesterase [Gammaproteobacteria bacterium]|nr:acyl-CoA thioesterase [Gammaproteobacteria bacterium]MDH3534526.1 acyl-CoA thioesterase [Gammaproteobacteria bacterium]
MSENPHGELTTRTMAMPADSNPSGDIFGGWVLAQMDIAAGICASERAQCRVVTVALDGMHFIRPVKIGDILCVYTEVKRVGNTSLEIHVEAWVQRDRSRNTVKVTQANFTFVALDENGRPRPVPPATAPESA